MFERYTNSARKVIVLANDGASTCHHKELESFHLLKGIMLFLVPSAPSEGPSPRFLHQVIAQSELAKFWTETATLEQIMPDGEQEYVGHHPFTRHAKGVMERAFRTALELKPRAVTVRVLLLALLSDELDPKIQQVLEAFSVDLAALQSTLTSDECVAADVEFMRLEEKYFAWMRTLSQATSIPGEVEAAAFLRWRRKGWPDGLSCPAELEPIVAFMESFLTFLGPNHLRE